MQNIQTRADGYTAESESSGSAEHLVCLSSQQSQQPTPLISSTHGSGAALNWPIELEH